MKRSLEETRYHNDEVVEARRLAKRQKTTDVFSELTEEIIVRNAVYARFFAVFDTTSQYIRLYNLDTGKHASICRTNHQVQGVQFAIHGASGRAFFIGSRHQPKSLVIWHIRDERVIQKIVLQEKHTVLFLGLISDCVVLVSRVATEIIDYLDGDGKKPGIIHLFDLNGSQLDCDIAIESVAQCAVWRNQLCVWPAGPFGIPDQPSAFRYKLIKDKIVLQDERVSHADLNPFGVPPLYPSDDRIPSVAVRYMDYAEVFFREDSESWSIPWQPPKSSELYSPWQSTDNGQFWLDGTEFKIEHHGVHPTGTQIGKCTQLHLSISGIADPRIIDYIRKLITLYSALPRPVCSIVLAYGGVARES